MTLSAIQPDLQSDAGLLGARYGDGWTTGLFLPAWRAAGPSQHACAPYLTVVVPSYPPRSGETDQFIIFSTLGLIIYIPFNSLSFNYIYIYMMSFIYTRV
jgi:hypothetical protein